MVSTTTRRQTAKNPAPLIIMAPQEQDTNAIIKTTITINSPNSNMASSTAATLSTVPTTESTETTKFTRRSMRIQENKRKAESQAVDMKKKPAIKKTKTKKLQPKKDKKIKEKSKNTDGDEEEEIPTRNELLALADDDKDKDKHNNKPRKSNDMISLYVQVLHIWPDDLINYAVGLLGAMKVACNYYHAALEPFANKRLNLVVLSESHARTKPELVGLPILPKHCGKVPAKYRRFGHLNLIHCLSYGATWLLGDKYINYDNAAKKGTLPFWKLFAVLAGQVHEELTKDNWDDNFKHLVKKKGEDRLANQIEILDQMEERGIVLLDLSPAHIYLAAGSYWRENQTSGRKYYDRLGNIKDPIKRQIFQICRDEYLIPLLKHYKPKNMVILGKTIPTLLKEHNEPKIQAVCDEIQCIYHGSIRHPSCDNGGQKYASHMNEIRTIASLSQK